MIETLLPGTDGAVAVQAVVAATVLLTALVLVRRDRELRLLVLGLMTMTTALFALRTLH